jgi:hypothetical protein
MNFQLETKQYIIIAIMLLLVWILWTNSLSPMEREKFYPIQEWPNIPPRQWDDNRNHTQWKPFWYYDSKYETPKYVSTWNPLWDSENRYHPAVPNVSNYHSDTYTLPPSTRGFAYQPEVEEGVEEENNPELYMEELNGEESL